MKTFYVCLIAFVLGACSFAYVSHDRRASTSRSFASPNGPVTVYFSPKGGCTEACVSVIQNARKTILLQAYSFTSDPIEDALVAAAKRGVYVRVIIDKGTYNMQGAGTDKLAAAGIEVYIDGKHPIAHNKIIIVDDETLVTGSFNFTKQAEIGNAENLLVIKDTAMSARYTENWNLHVGHSERYKP